MGCSRRGPTSALGRHSHHMVKQVSRQHTPLHSPLGQDRSVSFTWVHKPVLQAEGLKKLKLCGTIEKALKQGSGRLNCVPGVISPAE